MTRKIRIRRPVKSEEQPEEQREEEAPKSEEQRMESGALANAQHYAMLALPELRKLAEERGLVATGAKATLMRELMKYDLEHGDDVSEKQDEEPVRERKADNGRAPSPFLNMIESLRAGEVLTIQRMSEDTWSVAITNIDIHAHARKAATEKSGGLKGDAYEREVLSEEFYAWKFTDSNPVGKAWVDLSSEERYAWAEEHGVTWEEHESEKVDAMRLGQAVADHLKIEKYKPHYSSRAARKAIKA